jgi:CBS domain-containing protein
MATVRELLDRKGTDVHAVGPDATVLEAAQLMNRRGIGGLVVIDAMEQLIGIFTDQTFVRDVLTRDVVTMSADTTVEECAAVMSARRIRHLPVVEDGRMLGLVTSGDVLAHRVAESEATLQYMSSYLYDVR